MTVAPPKNDEMHPRLQLAPLPVLPVAVLFPLGPSQKTTIEATKA